MGEQTKIEWCDHTWNCWVGCTPVSPGCAHCYAERDARRFGMAKHFGAGAARHFCGEAHWKKLGTWDRKAGKDGVRRSVFIGSMMDVFDAEVQPIHRALLWATVEPLAHLDVLLLTKRPELARGMVPPHWLAGMWPGHVAVGATVEDQRHADARLPHLLALPAPMRFLSCEPLLGPVDLAFTCFNGTDSFGTMPGIHWVICGGESGPGARAMHPAWARGLRDQCLAAGVPFFFKQWGPAHAGDLLDGARWQQMPTARKGGAA